MNNGTQALLGHCYVIGIPLALNLKIRIFRHERYSKRWKIVFKGYGLGYESILEEGKGVKSPIQNKEPTYINVRYDGKISNTIFIELPMQIQANTLAFDDFYRLLSQTDVTTSPAEIHGVLCGFICVGTKLNGGFWIDSLLKRLGVRPPCLMLESQETVVGLYDAACRQLSGLQSFRLLLPDEKHDLEERAEALSFWCEGFLYGLGLGVNSFDEETSDVVHEALYCIAEIAKLDISQLEVTELDKLAYDEAIEFITQAIPLIYEELMHYPVEGSAGSAYLH
ncbi:MAG: UPF0149 family protein [Pseudomonadota bacterium]